MVDYIKLIKAYVFDYRLKKAKKKALAISKKKHCRCLVVVINKRPVTITMQQVRTLIRQKKLRKGLTADDVRKRALFQCM